MGVIDCWMRTEQLDAAEFRSYKLLRVYMIEMLGTYVGTMNPTRLHNDIILLYRI